MKRLAKMLIIMSGSCSIFLLSILNTDAATCRAIIGADAVTEAQKQGFRFSTAKMSGEGSCQITREAVVLSASALAGDGVECSIEYFSGARLNASWRIKAMRFDAKDIQWEYMQRPDLTSRDVRTRIKAKVSRGVAKTFNLLSLDLEGPNCTEWMQAFETSD